MALNNSIAYQKAYQFAIRIVNADKHLRVCSFQTEKTYHSINNDVEEISKILYAILKNTRLLN